MLVTGMTSAMEHQIEPKTHLRGSSSPQSSEGMTGLPQQLSEKYAVLVLSSNV